MDIALEGVQASVRELGGYCSSPSLCYHIEHVALFNDCLTWLFMLASVSPDTLLTYSEMCQKVLRGWMSEWKSTLNAVQGDYFSCLWPSDLLTMMITCHCPWPRTHGMHAAELHSTVIKYSIPAYRSRPGRENHLLLLASRIIKLPGVEVSQSICWSFSFFFF